MNQKWALLTGKSKFVFWQFFLLPELCSGPDLSLFWGKVKASLSDCLGPMVSACPNRAGKSGQAPGPTNEAMPLVGPRQRSFSVMGPPFLRYWQHPSLLAFQKTGKTSPRHWGWDFDQALAGSVWYVNNVAFRILETDSFELDLYSLRFISGQSWVDGKLYKFVKWINK